MNKTVNINLAGVFFHIDEDAYAKLQRYLAAIKRSFEGVQGEDEIIADIEARISELFSTKVQDARQVISSKELDEVIAVMGQPEDYMVDDDIFEDAPKSSSKRKSRPSSGKKLFRDTENAYIGGVSSGLGHYFSIDPLWIRLFWVFLVVIGFGSPILIYILLWILMPEAASTADQLSMRGKAVNIDNIQEKVKEGFENVSDAVKNVDYEKINSQAKKGARGFFQSIGTVIMFFLKILAKIFGVIFIIAGAGVVISLFITVITAGAIDIFNPGFTNIPELVNGTNAPMWVVLLLSFFAFGIPFFFLFYLGLKILSSNLKSMPLSAKLGLLGVWLASVIALGVLSVNQFVAYSNTGKETSRHELNIKADDTLHISMQGSQDYDIPFGRSNNYIQIINVDDEKTLVSRNVRLIVRSTRDTAAYMTIEKRANGGSFSLAKDRAREIDFNYALIGSDLVLDGFFTTPTGNRYSDQEVRVIVYLPENAILYADDNTYSYHRNDSKYRDILDNGDEEEYLIIRNRDLVCLDCPSYESSERRERKTRESEDEWKYREYQGNDKPDWEKDDSSTTDPIKDTIQKTDSI